MTEPWRPGPWHWAVPKSDPGWDDHGPWLTAADGTEIIGSWGHDAWGVVIDGDDMDDMDWEKEPSGANARLIALAPEMAALLEHIVTNLESWEGPSLLRPEENYVLKTARFLLSRARGETVGA